ncbi:penicillin-binding protein activator [Myxococcota bacterium]|nr:penicillin-binding protein activator [Myxococcota bacterium]
MRRPTRGGARSARLPGLLLAGLLLTGAGRRGQQDEAPEPVTQAVALAAEDRGAAIAALERLAGGEQAELLPWAKVWAGEQRRLAGDLAVARGWFEAAALDHPTHPVKDAAVLGMALVDAEGTLSGNTIATIQLKDTEVAPDTMRADRLRVLARTAANEGTPTRKVREMAAQALELASADPVVAERVRLVLADLLASPSGPRDDAPAVDAQGQALSPPARALAGARQALARRDFAQVELQARTIASSWPDSPEATQAALLARRAAAGDPTVAGRVGVLLPLTGEYAAASARIKDAITLANQQAGNPLELVFVDTKATATTAVAELERLVLEKGCVALVGPLHKDEVAAAAPIAQGLGVPMITMTQSGDPTAAGEYVFGGFLSLQAQVEALVAHAMDTLGLRTFGVLHPRNAYGDSARDLFGSAVARRGGTVVRIVPYDPNDKDYRDEARLLGNKLGRRPEKGTADPPNIDFDAIFLPDSFRRSTLVASALAYEEFPVGTFRPRFGGEGVPLLGLNGWNNPSVVEEGADYMRGAMFVDAFLPDQGGPAVTAFVATYQGSFDREPVLLDAVAYDTARVVAAAVMAGGEDRDEIRDQLGKVRLIDPVTGARGFGEGREIDRDLLVLRVGAERISLWRPPEADAPPAPGAPPASPP